MRDDPSTPNEAAASDVHAAQPDLPGETKESSEAEVGGATGAEAEADALVVQLVQAERWGELVDLLIARAEGAAREDRVAFLRQAADLFEERVGDLDSAFVTLEAVLPDANGAGRDVLAQMERIAARTGRFRDLAEAAAIVIDKEPEAAEAAALWRRVGRWYQQAEDPAAAAHAAEQALALGADDDETLRLVESGLRAQGRFAELAAVLSRRADRLAGNPAQVAATLEELMRIAEDQIGDRPLAAHAARELLRHEPSHAEARERLERALAQEAPSEEYVELLERRAERVTSEADWLTLQLQIASLWEDPLRRRDRAALTLEAVLAAAPAHEGAARSLERIYRETNDLRPLLALLGRHAAQVEGEERAELAFKRGELALRLEERDLARVSFAEALAIIPDHEEALLAAAAIEEESGDPEVALALLGRRAALEADGARKAGLLFRAGTLALERLDDPGEAEQRWKEALIADPTHADVALALARLRRAHGGGGAAAEALATAAHLRQGRERLELLLEAAALGRGAGGDRERAYELYAEAHEIDPENEEALAGLSELSHELEDWGPALRFAEALARQTSPADKRQLARVHLRAAQAAARLAGEEDRLKLGAHLGRALHGGPEIWAEALAWAGGIAGVGDGDASLRLHEALLAHRPTSATAAETAELSFRLGEAHMRRAAAEGRAADDARSDRETARRLLGSAILHSPNHRQAREALAALLLAAGDTRGAAEHKRALLDRTVDEADAFALLAELVGLLRGPLRDEREAVVMVERALAIRPNDRGMLLEALDLYAATRKWKLALEVLQRLADGEQGVVRARTLVAAANILHRELGQDDDALALYEEALALEPEDDKTFERIERILAERDDVAGLERAATHRLERLGEPADEAGRTRAAALWQSVAELRRRGGDRDGAIEAYERCLAARPEDGGAAAALGVLLAETGPAGRTRAVALAREKLTHAPTAGARISALRALRTLCTSGPESAERAHQLTAALVALGAATAEEQAAYEAARPQRAPRPRRPVTLVDLQGPLADGEEDAALSRVFGALGEVVAWVRAQERKALKLPKAPEPTAEQTLFGRSYVALREALAFALPPFFLQPEEPGGLALVGVRGRKEVETALLARAALLSPRPEPELAFSAARRLVLARPDCLALWPSLVPTDGERLAIVIAAGRLIHPALEAPAHLAQAAETYVELFRKALPPSAFDELALVPPALFSDVTEQRIARYRRAAVRGAARAALLLTGDLPAALRALAAETPDAEEPGSGPEGPTEAERDALRDELVAFAVSDAHLTLRRELGLATA